MTCLPASEKQVYVYDKLCCRWLNSISCDENYQSNHVSNLKNFLFKSHNQIWINNSIYLNQKCKIYIGKDESQGVPSHTVSFVC